MHDHFQVGASAVELRIKLKSACSDMSSTGSDMSSTCSDMSSTGTCEFLRKVV